MYVTTLIKDAKKIKGKDALDFVK